MRETIFVPDSTWTLRRQRRGPLLWILLVANVAMGLLLAYQLGAFAAITRRSAGGAVTNLYTGKPIANAAVVFGSQSQRTTQLGQYGWPDPRSGDQLLVSAEGYSVATVNVSKRSSWSVALRPTTLHGRITDSTSGQALQRAAVAVGDEIAFTDRNGEYRLEGVGENPQLVVKAPGYLSKQITVQRSDNQDVALQPFQAKGVYVTSYVAAHEDLMASIFALLDRTELNTIVVDMKNDEGAVAYDSKVPLVQEAGAEQSDPVDLNKLIATARQHGVYTIARIVVFHDPVLAKARPDWTAKSKRTGSAWLDSSGQAWMDPFREEVWRYNIAIAREVAEHGFDEVQFDYVRFPSDGNLSDLQYSVQPDVDRREGAIEGFLATARSSLAALPTYVSADLFGLTLWAEDDMGIGQKIQGVARWMDYVSPMMYPSHFSSGVMGFEVPAEHPYEILAQGGKQAINDLAGKTARYRPWLQDFTLTTPYDAKRVRQQIDAAEANGSSGWMLWNVQNKYTEAALQPN